MPIPRLLSPQEFSALVDRFSRGAKTGQIETWLRAIGLGSVRGKPQIAKLYLLSKAEFERHLREAPTSDVLSADQSSPERA
jgi:hypothetical protein